MKNSHIFVVLLFLLLQFSVYAQSGLKGKVYADINIGTLVLSNSQLQVGAGYLFSKNHGLGISYHRETSGSTFNPQGFQGIGIDYRYATDFGLIVKAGLGKMLTAWAATDFHDEFTYKSSKLFTDLSVVYQIKPGFTFGLFWTSSPEIIFERYLPQWCVEPFTIDSEELIYQDDVSREFINFGIAIGYALPLKKKKK